MDKIGGILSTALGGIQRNLRGLGAAAHELAAPQSTAPAELAGPLVRALEEQRALEAGAAVLGRTGAALDALLSALHR